MQVYFTDRKTNRKEQSWCGIDFQKFEKNNEKYNQKYDEAMISVFKSEIDGKEESIYVEHNEKLTKENIKRISEAIIINK